MLAPANRLCAQLGHAEPAGAEAVAEVAVLRVYRLIRTIVFGSIVRLIARILSSITD